MAGRRALVPLLLGLLASGCTHETLLTELGTTAGARPPAQVTWRQPGLDPLGALDGAGCTWANQCRSGYCAEGRCAPTDAEEPSIAVAPPLPQAAPMLH